MPDRIWGGGSKGGGAMIMTQWTVDRTGNSQNVAHFYFLLLKLTIYNQLVGKYRRAILISGAISIIYIQIL